MRRNTVSFRRRQWDIRGKSHWLRSSMLFLMVPSQCQSSRKLDSMRSRRREKLSPDEIYPRNRLRSRSPGQWVIGVTFLRSRFPRYSGMHSKWIIACFVYIINDYVELVSSSVGIDCTGCVTRFHSSMNYLVNFRNLAGTWRTLRWLNDGIIQIDQQIHVLIYFAN